MAYDGTITIDTKIETKGAESDLKKLNDLVKSKLSISSKLVNGFLDNISQKMGDALTPAIASITEDFKKAFTSGVNFSSIAQLFTGDLSLATIAQNGLSAAFKASPIGTFTLAVSAATEAFTFLAPILSAVNAKIEEQDVVLQNRKAADTRIAAIQEETDAYRERRQAQIESMDADLAQITHVEGLAKELDTLVDANGRVKQGQEDRVRFILSELNPLLDAEIQLVDGQIQKYDALQDKIAQTIEMQRAQSMLGAAKENYDNAISSIDAEREALGEATRVYEDAQRAYADFRAKHADDLKFLQDPSAEETDPARLNYIMNDTEWYPQIAKQEAALEHLKQAREDQLAVVERCSTGIQTYENAQTAALAGNSEECIRILNESNAQYRQAQKINGETEAERKQQLAQFYADQVYKESEYIEGCLAGREQFNQAVYQQIRDDTEALRQETEKQGIEMVDGQVEGVNGQKIYLEEALNTLAESQEKLRASQKESWETSGHGDGADYNASLADALALSPEEARAMVQGTQEPLTTATREAIHETRETINGAVTEADFPQVGRVISTAEADSITESTGEVTEAAENSVQAVKKAADEQVERSDFKSTGRHIIELIAEGIRGGSYLLNLALIPAIQQAVTAGKTALDNGIASVTPLLARPFQPRVPAAELMDPGSSKSPLGQLRALMPPSHWAVSTPIDDATAARWETEFQAGVAMNQARMADAIAPRAMHHIYTAQLAAPAGAAAGPNRVNNYYSVSIDAKNVKEFNDVVKIAQRAVMSYRQGYVDH